MCLSVWVGGHLKNCLGIVQLAEARKADEQASKVTELVKAQRALKSAKKRVADNQASLQTASQALQDAVKAVQR